MVNQIVQCMAIVTTSLPYTKMFMEGFESGMLRVDRQRMDRRRAETPRETVACSSVGFSNCTGAFKQGKGVPPWW